MTLLLKHILRSIKKAPLQPIIILITLTIAVSTFICAAKLSVNVLNEEAAMKHTDTFISDITIKLSKSDDVRLLFEDDTRDVIGDDGKVLGEFALTALTKKDGKTSLIKICAADIIEADDFYNFRFCEYGNFTTTNLNDSVIISKSTAKKYDLKLGDTLTLKLLNKSFNFTVQAIAENDGALYSNAAIVNIGAVSEALIEANPAIAAFIDTDPPSTELKIRLNDSSRCDEFIEKLKADERFSDKLIIKESENTGGADFLALMSLVIILICALILAIISSIVIFTSLDLLSKKRMKDSALFMLCGARNGQLNLMLYLECGIYAITSAILGLLLSIPLNAGLNTVFEWEVETAQFGAMDVIVALLSAPVLISITSFVHMNREKKLSLSDRISDRRDRKAKKSPYIISLILFIASAVTVAITLSLKTEDQLVPAVIGALLFIAFMYSFVPCFVTSVSILLIKIIEKMRRIPPKTILALKNTKVSYPLKHSARLIAILLTLVSVAVCCLAVLTKETKNVAVIADAQYVALGANEKTDEIIENVDTVDSTFRMLVKRNILTSEGTALIGISVNDEAREALHESVRPKRLPKNNEIAIAKGTAKLSGVGVGDTITITHETNKYELTVIEILDSSTNIAIMDASYIGEKNELLCIKTSAPEDSEEFARIVNALELRGSAIVGMDAVLMPLIDRLIDYADLLTYVILIAVATTVLAIINVLFSAYTVRKNERKVYYTAGMTSGQIRATVFIEILALVLFAIALMPLFTIGLDLIIDLAVNSLGIDMFPF